MGQIASTLEDNPPYATVHPSQVAPSEVLPIVLTVDPQKNYQPREMYKAGGSANVVESSPYSRILEYNLKIILNNRANSLTSYLLTNELYSPWMKHWKMLETNLRRNKIGILNYSDPDAGYTIDKNRDCTKVKIHDSQRFIPFNVITHILVHEMAHLSLSITSHDYPFFELLSIMVFAAAELRFFDFTAMKNSTTVVNGVETTSNRDLRAEIQNGGITIVQTLCQNDPALKQAVQKYLNGSISMKELQQVIPANDTASYVIYVLDFIRWIQSPANDYINRDIIVPDN